MSNKPRRRVRLRANWGHPPYVQKVYSGDLKPTNLKIFVEAVAILRVAPHANVANNAKVPPLSDPPRGAELLLRFLLSATDQDAFIGDLEETFHTVMVPRYGERWARAHYWWHALWSLVPVLVSRLRKLAVFSLLAKLAELFSRLG